MKALAKRREISLSALVAEIDAERGARQPLLGDPSVRFGSSASIKSASGWIGSDGVGLRRGIQGVVA